MRISDWSSDVCSSDLKAACLTAKGQRIDFEVETFIAEMAATLPAGGNRTGGDRPPGMGQETADTMLIAHSLRGEGFDASEDGTGRGTPIVPVRSEEHTSELQSLMRISYAVFCLKKKNKEHSIRK